MPISVSVNVSKLDKRKFFKGKKGTYVDLVLWESEGEAEEYGDYIVKQRGEKGDKLPILGNAKHFDLKKSKGKNRRRDDDDRRNDNDNDDEIPF